MNISKFVSNKFYGQKDIKKFEDCSKLISMGAVGSSSHNYSKHPKANLSQYDKCDVVGISINGNRKNRVSIESFVDELNLAIDSKVKKFVIDDKYNRNRSYNVGEREVEKFLLSKNFKEIYSTGIFVSKV